QEGSSFGVSRVAEAADFASAFEAAAAFGCDVLAETCVIGGEYTVPVLEDRALPVIRLETPREFYDYTAKYEADSTQYICPAGLPLAQERRAGALALQAFAALGASGWARVDFFIDTVGNIQLIELNTVPGMTDHSLVPMSAAHEGISFQQLVVRILGTSLGQRT
ncbi:MAG: D-alanine--D-alanine ligase, partial [Gammaproteobacteria bacterium]|nr:D-alanine--D-alanine ligase [Gammaproteobacteria bacterium]